MKPKPQLDCGFSFILTEKSNKNKTLLIDNQLFKLFFNKF